MRDAILASPAWPDIAAAMGQLDAKGIDVARIPLDAHAAGAGVDQAVAAVTTAAAAGAPAPAPAAPAAPPPPPPRRLRLTPVCPHPPLRRVPRRLPRPLLRRRCGRSSIRGRGPPAWTRSAPGAR
ncbi:hypothetical protein [Streptomyces sp. NPDC054797]